MKFIDLGFSVLLAVVFLQQADAVEYVPYPGQVSRGSNWSVIEMYDPTINDVNIAGTSTDGLNPQLIKISFGEFYRKSPVDLQKVILFHEYCHAYLQFATGRANVLSRLSIENEADRYAGEACQYLGLTTGPDAFRNLIAGLGPVPGAYASGAERAANFKRAYDNQATPNREFTFAPNASALSGTFVPPPPSSNSGGGGSGCGNGSAVAVLLAVGLIGLGRQRRLARG